jgi:hypothetical protein
VFFRYQRLRARKKCCHLVVNKLFWMQNNSKEITAMYNLPRNFVCHQKPEIQNYESSATNKWNLSEIDYSFHLAKLLF